MSEAPASIGNHPCQATRKDGRPCSASALADGFCFAHSPSLQEKREAARAKGGKGKSRLARADKLVPATMRPVVRTLLEALDEVRDGTLTPAQASAMAAVAGALVRVYTVGQIEERIAALEAAQPPQPGRWRA